MTQLRDLMTMDTAKLPATIAESVGRWPAYFAGVIPVEQVLESHPVLAGASNGGAQGAICVCPDRSDRIPSTWIVVWVGGDGEATGVALVRGDETRTLDEPLPGQVFAEVNAAWARKGATSTTAQDCARAGLADLGHRRSADRPAAP